MIALLGKESFYFMGDNRMGVEIPGRGVRFYDCSEAISWFEGRKLWVIGSGQTAAGNLVYKKLSEFKIKLISDLEKIKEEFFEEIHIKALEIYGMIYDRKKEPEIGMHLIFGGIDFINKIPRLCYITSLNNYRKIYLTEKGQYLILPTGDEELDKFINLNVREFIKRYKDKEYEYPFCDVKKYFKKIFDLISQKNQRIGKLTFILEVHTNGEIKFKEHHKLIKHIDKLRLKFDLMIYKGTHKIVPTQ
jgi:hypothetical protein